MHEAARGARFGASPACRVVLGRRDCSSGQKGVRASSDLASAGSRWPASCPMGCGSAAASEQLDPGGNAIQPGPIVG